MTGTILADRYELQSELGRGGTGVVYRAHDPVLKRDVAVKVLSGAPMTPGSQARLLEEARAAAQINHPGIVSIYDAGLVGDTALVVMELVEGPSLHEMHPDSTRDVCRIGREICAALDHAHRSGIVHRDLKPENILLTPSGKVKLVDFGLARPVASRITTEGALAGSLHYIAPEQALGQPTDARTDLYALGVILYELLALRLPFSADDPLALIAQHIYAPVVPPRAYRRDLPPALNDLVVQLLSKQPQDRPASAAEVEERLAAIERVEEGAESLPASVAGEIPMLDRIARGRLVGRQAELASAASLWRKAEAGKGHVLLVSGEPGVGKTRFVREVAAQAQISHGRVVSAECHPEGGAPYAPIARLVRQALMEASTPPLTPEAASALVALAPDLRSRFPDAPPNPTLEPLAERDRICNSLTALCLGLAAVTPVLIFVDDIHWADNGSLYTLRQLARVAAAQRILIVLTYREIELGEGGALPEMLHELTREHLATRIKLSRLTRQETGQMLETMFGAPVAAELAEGIYREAEGNPFFVEEVCKALVQDERISLHEGRWEAQDELEELTIPQSVRLAIQLRVSRLPQPAQEVLRTAAVLGREFSFDILRAAMDVDEETVIEALEIASRAQLVSERRPNGARPPSMEFTFEHALIPTALREGMSGLRLQRLHRRAAAAYEALRPDDLESIGFHAAGAGDEDRARRCYLQAAERARRMGALEDAVRFCESAVEIWPAADRAGRADVLFELANCQWIMADGRSLQTMQETRDLYQSIGHRVRSGELERMIGRAYWELGNRRTAMQHYRQALTILEAEPESPELARAVSSMSQMHMLASEYDQAIEWGERALRLSETLDAADVRVHALNNIGTARLMLGDRAAGLALVRQSLEGAQELGLAHDVARAYLNLAEGLITDGEYPAARQVLLDMLAYTTKMYVRGFTHTANVRLAEIEWLMGDWAAGLERLQALTEPASLNAGVSGLWARTLQGRMMNDLGRNDQARELLEERLPEVRATGEIQTLAPHLGQLARAYAASGDQAALEGIVHELLTAVDRNPYVERDTAPALLAACRSQALMPSSDSVSLARGLLPRLERADQQLRSTETRASLDEAVGVVALASGKAEDAVAHLAAAAQGWHRIQRSYDEARARTDLGIALGQSGEASAARATLQEALRLFDLLRRGLGEGESVETFASSRIVSRARNAMGLLPPSD